MLASLYDGWVNQLLGAPLPPETKATCGDCAMLPQPGSDPSDPGIILFLPETKCCTFEPPLVNYRAGLILSDDDPDLAAGRSTVEERLRIRTAVTPWGLHTSARFHLLYENSANNFGRNPALTCPHYIGEHCGIWRHNPATCTTWFCKHVRGATGFEFWSKLGQMLREVDRKLGRWSVSELGVDVGTLGDLLEEPRTVEAAELGGPAGEDRYRALWGKWVDHEAEFYRLCAERVQRLEWDDLARICGPRLTALATLVRESFAKLSSQTLPQRPVMGLIQIEGMKSGKFSTVTYSLYDPLRMSPELTAVVPLFDGRPTDDVLDEIRSEHGIRLDPALISRMMDFRVLVEGPST